MNLNVPPHGLRTANETPRVDLVLIAEMVTPGARVLDIGCGDGDAAAPARGEARRRRRAASSSPRPG